MTYQKREQDTGQVAREGEVFTVDIPTERYRERERREKRECVCV